jgi:hypothetical protein
MDEKIVITESPNLKSLNTSVSVSEPKKSNMMESLKNTFSSSTPAQSSSPATTESTKSVVASSAGFFSNFSWTKILLILLLLSFMGINIFSSLAEVSDWIGNTLGPVFRKFLGLIGMTTVKVSEKAVDVTATGAKTGIDIVAGTLDSGLEVIEGQLQDAKQRNDAKMGASAAGASANSSSATAPGTGSESNNTLNTALAEALPQIPEPDDATSNTQSNRTGKAGFCYIGEDRGFRSCIEVKENDTCMSGQIFPTSEICVNPNLRE